MVELPRNPLVPAYRLASNSKLLVFRCPGCGELHTHGVGDGLPVQWRGSHCAPQSRLGGKNVRLMVCGTVPSRRLLPQLTAKDVTVLNSRLAEVDDAGSIVPPCGAEPEAFATAKSRD